MRDANRVEIRIIPRLFGDTLLSKSCLDKEAADQKLEGRVTHMNKLLGLIPGMLIIPFWVLGFLYAIFVPETLYYALGIYLDLWFPVLDSFWGYVIVLPLFAIPFLNAGLLLLLIFQSFMVLAKFIFGSYEPSLHGFITMYPATMAVVVIVVSRLYKDSE